MKKNKSGLLTVTLLLVAGLLAACGDATATVGNSATNSTASSTTSAAGATTTGGAATTRAAGTTGTAGAGTTAATGATTGTAGTGTTAAGTGTTTSAAGTSTTVAGGTATSGTRTGATTTSGAGATTTSGTGTGATATSGTGTGTTPGASPAANSPALALAYPNTVSSITLKPELEKTFAQTFASNLSNPMVRTFTTADDPTKVVTFYTDKLTGLGYTTVTNASAPNPLQNGLKGLVATFSCQSTASSTANCSMGAMPGMTPGATTGNNMMTANGVQLVAIGPLDAIVIGLLSTQAPDLASYLKAGNSIVMVFSGALNAPRP